MAKSPSSAWGFSNWPGNDAPETILEGPQRHGGDEPAAIQNPILAALGSQQERTSAQQQDPREEHNSLC